MPIPECHRSGFHWS